MGRSKGRSTVSAQERTESFAWKLEHAGNEAGGTLIIPRGRMRLAALARVSLCLGENLGELAVALSVLGKKTISCRKGCGACCCHVVPLSPPEAWMISEMVAALPEERREQTLSRFHLLQAILRKNGLGDAPLLSEAKEYFRTGAPCPFLTEESCGIHRCRPHACRECLVTTPASLCSDPAGRSIEFVPVPARLSECLSVLSASLLGGAPEMIPLVHPLDWAAEHEEEGHLEWDGRFLAARLLNLANMEFRRESGSG